MIPEERFKIKSKEIDIQIIKTSVTHSIGSILFALGLYATFEDSASALHPMFGNQMVVNVMLGLGAIIIIMGGLKIVSLAKEKIKLRNVLGSKF